MEDPRFIVFYDANLALEPDLGGYVKEGSPFVVHISPDELFDRKETAAVLVHELTHTGQNMAGRHEDTYQHCLDMEGEAYTAQQQFLMSNYGTSFVDPIPQAAAADCNTHTW